MALVEGINLWLGFGSRSGLLEPQSSTATAADAIAQATAAAPAAEVTSSATPTAPPTVPDSTAWNGPRDDVTGGWGVRVRIGQLSDGSYGVERFTQAGVRQVPTWA